MSIIDDVAYCFSRSQDEFASNDYNTGAYYQNEKGGLRSPFL